MNWMRSVAGVAMVCSMLSAGGQNHGTTMIPPSGQQGVGAPEPRQTHDPSFDMEAKQLRMRNIERQKRLVGDTEKLLQLATQLHEDVAKTDRNTLSMDVIKRADEIERLAHSVKEKMKG